MNHGLQVADCSGLWLGLRPPRPSGTVTRPELLEIGVIGSIGVRSCSTRLGSTHTAAKESKTERRPGRFH